jgi:hypothetical protein
MQRLCMQNSETNFTNIYLNNSVLSPVVLIQVSDYRKLDYVISNREPLGMANIAKHSHLTPLRLLYSEQLGSAGSALHLF